jgi:predicted nucleic acid-binding protein
VTRLVLDASAAVEIFLGTPEGRRLAAQTPPRSETHVPEHFYVEVAAAFRRLELAGVLAPDRAAVGFRRLLELTTVRAQVRPLLPAAWALRQNITVADAVYVVLARSLGATLVTGDKRLAKAPTLGIPVIS